MILQEEKVEIVETQNEPEFKKVPPENGSAKRVLLYIAIFIGILFLIFLIVFGAFTLYNHNNKDVIAKGIYVYGIDVSGLNKKEALEKVSSTFEKVQSTDIKLVSGEYETYINPTEINLKFDIDSAINYAFSIGKSGKVVADNYDIFSIMLNGTNITPIYSLDEDALKTALDKLSKELPNAVVDSSYYVENSTLIITKGKDGYIINSDKTLADIKSKINDLSFLSQAIELSLTPKSPAKIDLDKIYDEIHTEAKDAYFTTNPHVVHPSSNGVDFKISLAEAKKKLDEADSECKIALKTVYPKITTNMLGREAFPDLLAEYSTTYSASKTNRTTNLKLAAGKVNGTVLLPGETFSYNKVVGERTIAAGYKEAGVYVNGELVDGLGGGICQISSTIFNTALLSNMKIEEIHNHPYVSSYVPVGRDATVAYGAKDFKFSNSRQHAIKIECTVSGGVAKCKIYGVKENPEYTVKINAKITSQTDSYTKSVTYRILSLNGKQVSSEKIYNCTYKRH